MFKKYLKISFRVMRRNKLFTFINISGLALGISTCILILIWINYELSFNRFHKNLNRIYLVAQTQHYKTIGNFTVSPTPPPLATALTNEYPEILRAARYTPYLGRRTVIYKDKKFKERVDFADADFFRIFSFSFIEGNPKTAFADPYSVIITRETADKYFGNENPMGKILHIDGKYDFKITGVVANIPRNSDISFTLISSFETLRILGQNIDNWGNNSLFTYVLLQKGVDDKVVSTKIKDRIQKVIHVSIKPELFLFPFKKFHLYSLSGSGGRIENVILFSIIAVFILLIACINFINLTTAGASKRAKEVAIEKVVGAGRANLMVKFFAESILITLIAAGFSLFWVELLLPIFNSISGQEFSFADIHGSMVFLFIGIALVAGIIAGIYPAFYTSAFQPVTILKRLTRSASGNLSLRSILVIAQFTISITLLIATVVVFLQVQFMRNKNLGIDKDNIVYFSVDKSFRDKIPDFEYRLRQNNSIISAAGASTIPINVYTNGGGGWSWPGKDPQQHELITFLGADYNFLKCFNTKLADGRFFSKEFSSDSENSIVINQTFADLIGGGSIVGKTLTNGNQHFTIIGVLNDFNFTRVQNKIGPLLLYLDHNPGYLFIKLQNKNIAKSLDYLKKIYGEFDPTSPLEVHFLDDTYERMFFSEKRLSKLFAGFTVLAIVISCLGIFALAFFLAEQKTKEIGIRKILGASVVSVTALLSRNFAKLVLLANLIAWPIAWYAMNKWLQNFAYRISIEWWVFVLAGGLALVIALLTVSTQAVRAALANPVESLRYE